MRSSDNTTVLCRGGNQSLCNLTLINSLGKKKSEGVSATASDGYFMIGAAAVIVTEALITTAYSQLRDLCIKS